KLREWDVGSTLSGPPRPGEPDLAIHLRETTVLGVLNAIVRVSHGGWSIQERRCAGGAKVQQMYNNGYGTLRTGILARFGNVPTGHN
ncbi:MAG: hypothetical protein ACREDJ_06895, partial [Methylocella sp.]